MLQKQYKDAAKKLRNVKTSSIMTSSNTNNRHTHTTLINMQNMQKNKYDDKI